LATHFNVSNPIDIGTEPGLTASPTPRECFRLDPAYNFHSVIQNATICFNDTPPMGVILTLVGQCQQQ
jgi:hypothetical protein